MKVLQVVSYYYPNIGGIEQVARDISNSIKDVERKVICFNHEKGDSVDTVDGVEIKRVGCFIKVASQSLSTHCKKALRETFNEFNPDVVIFHYPNPFWAHYLLKELKKYPNTKLVLYWHLDIYKQKILKKFFKGQTERLLKRASRVIATSPNYIEGSEFLPKYREKCEVISCCVNDDRTVYTDEMVKRAKEIKDENKDKTICFALGRHVPYKGMEYLVRASKFLGDEYAVYIAGKGPLTGELEELAKGDDKVKFLGKVSDFDLKSYLLATDIFCFPSITKNEAFGIALAESMFYGKPSVTFTVEGSGINYVSLDGITGIEVENKNVEQYAKAIKELAIDKNKRETFANNAKQRAQEYFTFKIFKDKINALIEGLSN